MRQQQRRVENWSEQKNYQQKQCSSLLFESKDRWTCSASRKWLPPHDGEAAGHANKTRPLRIEIGRTQFQFCWSFHERSTRFWNLKHPSSYRRCPSYIHSTLVTRPISTPRYSTFQGYHDKPRHVILLLRLCSCSLDFDDSMGVHSETCGSAPSPDDINPLFGNTSCGRLVGFTNSGTKRRG